MKVRTLIRLLQDVDPEKEVVQEGDEIIDVGWCQGNHKYVTTGVREDDDRVILEREDGEYPSR